MTNHPFITSAVVSVNLRPLANKTFKDPVMITLGHSVVGSTTLVFSNKVIFAYQITKHTFLKIIPSSS